MGVRCPIRMILLTPPWWFYHGVCVGDGCDRCFCCALSSLRRFQKFNNEWFCFCIFDSYGLQLASLGNNIVGNLPAHPYNHQPIKGRYKYQRSGDRRGRKSASPYTQECSMQSYYMFRKGHYIILQRFLGPLLQ